ncbi:MAG: outer membrane protein assembly factor BamD [Phycisphaeraceae bacterium]
MCACLVIISAPSSPAHAQSVFELHDGELTQIHAPDPDTPEGELQAVAQAIAEERGKDAIKLADAWIENYPNHPLLARAFLLRGDARVSRNHLYASLFDYEVVMRRFPASEEFEVALEREFSIAETFSRGTKRLLWGMRLLPAYGEAEELFIRIQERSPGSRIAERAGIELADHYYRQSEMLSAAEAYDLFLQNFPRSQWREYAMQRQILANLATFRGPRFDATGLIDAESRLEEYAQTYPAAAEQIGAEALATRIDETLAERSLLVAHWYRDRGERVSAIYMYRRLIQDHPGSAAAQQAIAQLRRLDPTLFRDGEMDPPAQTEPNQP